MSTHERRSWLGGKIFMAASLVGALAVAVGACGTDDGPRRAAGGTSSGVGASTGSGGEGGGLSTGACEGDEIRGCKVWIDENNCFVGEQQCSNGEWGPCVEPGDLGTNSFNTKSISMPGNCTNNPCNPECQQFDEDPAMDLTAPGAPPPPVATATVNDIASSWTNACLKDMANACAQPCDSSGPGSGNGACQFDTYCDDPPADFCVPWSTGQYDMAAGNPNFTLGVVCNPSAVPVCNRGDVAAGMGVVISGWSPNNRLCGDDCGSDPYTTGQASVSNQYGTCTIPTDIAPGDCIAVDCGAAISGQTMLHVNGCDYSACVPESDPDDNFGIYDPSASCQCAATSQSAGLAPVTIFLVLDNSQSMINQGLWGPAQTAVKAFITDPGSDNISLAMRMYGSDPVAGCDSSSCDTNACAVMAHGPTSLANAAYETTLTTYIDNAPTGGAGTPHHPSTKGMYKTAEDYADANPGTLVATVYISDGDYPAQCGQDIAHMSGHASDALLGHGVRSFAVALPSASLPLLDGLAAAGGSTQAINLTGSADVAGDLTAALQAIQGSLFSCTLPIPNASDVDPATVVVDYLPGAGGSVLLTQVANAGACSGGNQFYFEPDAVNPTDLTLCPAICTTVQNDAGADVQLTGGCVGTYTSDSQVFEYTPDCSAYPSGAGPVWDFLSYDTDVPGDATVVWEVSTSLVDAADAALGPWTMVATSTFADPDAPESSPIDLEAALGPLVQQPYLALRITLNPTTGGLGTPTVFDWNLKYSCTSVQ